MNFSEIFIRRPIATSLLLAGIALFGVVAYKSMAMSDLPSVDYPTISVSASLPGADPNTMSSAVATVLERQFTTSPGIDSMTSRSSTGSTNVTFQIGLIMLIGIVKKNAIMQIDFALDAERNQGMPPEKRSIRAA